MAESNNQFIEEDISEYMSGEELEKILTYICKKFDVIEDSKIQLKNCMNLIEFIKKHNLVIGEIEAERLLDKSDYLRNMFRVLNNADVLVRVECYPEIRELCNLYCLRNDVILGKDIDSYYADSNYGEKKDLDLIRVYFNEIGKYKLLSVEEERELVIRIKNGDEEALHKLIEHNLRLVVPIAKRYVNPFNTMDDLIQFGNEGLMVAARRFDVNKNCKFSTYAYWWIRQSVTRGLFDYGRTIRLPIHVQEQIYRIKKVQNKYFQEYERFPSIEEISEITHYEIGTVKRAIECMDLTVSLSTPINKDHVLADVIEDYDSNFDNVDHVANRELVLSLFKKAHLNDREMFIIKARYNFLDRKYTLEEIAKRYGITRERVRQIELKVLNKLKKASIVYDFDILREKEGKNLALSYRF